jgi:hypothetical protein
MRNHNRYNPNTGRMEGHPEIPTIDDATARRQAICQLIDDVVYAAQNEMELISIMELAGAFEPLTEHELRTILNMLTTSYSSEQLVDTANVISIFREKGLLVGNFGRFVVTDEFLAMLEGRR